MFLPTTIKEVRERGWDQLDVILFSGDAYIDHPAFGAAVVGRLLEAEGYRVAIVPQPNWRDDLRDLLPLCPAAGARTYRPSGMGGTVGLPPMQTHDNAYATNGAYSMT